MLIILDVRDLPIERQQACVLKRFEVLAAGDVLRVVTDRDPHAWRDALLGDARWHVQWLPERQGPDVWVVRVEKQPRSAND